MATTLECQQCGHERETDTDTPTILVCSECGSKNLQPADRS